MTPNQLALVDQLRFMGGGANQVADWVEAEALMHDSIDDEDALFAADDAYSYERDRWDD